MVEENVEQIQLNTVSRETTSNSDESIRQHTHYLSDSDDEVHEIQGSKKIKFTSSNKNIRKETLVDIDAEDEEDQEDENEDEEDAQKDKDSEIIVIAEDIAHEQVGGVIDDDDIEIIEKPTFPKKNKGKGEPVKSITEYQCPICMDPPTAAMITKCGHVFCAECLFDMLNSSRTYTKPGMCALCRTNIPLNKTHLMIMKFKKVKKGSMES